MVLINSEKLWGYLNKMISMVNNTNNITFTSRSGDLRRVGDICRRVTLEFPIVYSDSCLAKFNTKFRCKSFNRIMDFTSDLIEKFRVYYDVENLNKYYKREIFGLKKHKAGNCQEISDATYMALKMNGYEDVKQLRLYAYNQKTKSMKDLDHVVTGVNFKLPEDYKYINYEPTNYMPPEYRIYPQRKSIVVDSWSGFAEYGRNLIGKYDRADLLRGLTAAKPRKTFLKEGEELCFVPVKGNELIPNDTVETLKWFFPNLNLSEKFSTSKNDSLELELSGVGLKSSDIKKLKRKYKITSQRDIK